jgi:hypothetical protein
MPRLSLVVLSVSLGAVCAIVLAACGSDDGDGTIPPESAQALIQSLEDARGEQSQGDCQGVADAAGNLLTQIDQLPDSVDPEVRRALVEGANNLRGLGEDEANCGGTGPTGQEGPKTTDTTTTAPTTTEETTSTTTTETTTTKEPPEQPPNEGNVPNPNSGGGNTGQGNGPTGEGPPAGGETEPDTGGTGGGG